MDVTQRRGAAGTLEGHNDIQQDLDKLVKWVYGKLKQLNKAKCWHCTWAEAPPCIKTGWGLVPALLGRTWGSWWMKTNVSGAVREVLAPKMTRQESSLAKKL